MGNGGKWKAKSKRISTKTRVKVEKKVKEHAKKLKSIPVYKMDKSISFVKLT